MFLKIMLKVDILVKIFIILFIIFDSMTQEITKFFLMVLIVKY